MSRPITRKAWTPEELKYVLEARAAGHRYEDIAAALGGAHTVRAITQKVMSVRQMLNGPKAGPPPLPPFDGSDPSVQSFPKFQQQEQLPFAGPFPKIEQPPLPPEPTLEEDRARADENYWKERHKELLSKFEKLNKEQSVVEKLVQNIMLMAPIAYDPAPPADNHPSQRPGDEEQTAVLHLSDTHIGQVITGDQTDGFGKYDFATFKARLKYLERGVVSITHNHTTTRVPRLVVAMGGDMLHGALLHSAEAAQHSTLWSQFYVGGHVFAQFLRNLGAHFERVDVETVVGNHTRWGHQHKMPTLNRYSNLDQFMYSYCESLTRGLGNIHWRITEQPSADFEVYGHKFRMLHGDTLRGGDKALGIPNHAVGRLLSITTQLLSKVDRPGPDYYLIGHFHREISIPHARGAVLFNGGFPGLDTFGLSAMFNPVDPTQRFFLVHPKYGATAQYSMSLRFADPSDADAYVCPDCYLIP